MDTNITIFQAKNSMQSAVHYIAQRIPTIHVVVGLFIVNTVKKNMLDRS